MTTLSLRRALRPLGAALALALLASAATSRLAPAHAAPSAATMAPFDQQFIDMMVPHHMSAVAMAQIALTRGQHPQIKALAGSIISDQNSEIGQMKTWRRQWYGSATTPDMMHMPMLPGLRMGMGMGGPTFMNDINNLKKANPFDKAFIADMMPHHQMAIDAATLELAHGSHQQLKDLALSIIKGQSREEGLMQAYLDLWYGGGMGPMGGMGH